LASSRNLTFILFQIIGIKGDNAVRFGFRCLPFHWYEDKYLSKLLRFLKYKFASRFFFFKYEYMRACLHLPNMSGVFVYSCLDSLLKNTPLYLRTCQWHGSLNVCVVSPALCHTSQSVNFADLKRNLWKEKIDC